MYRPGDLVIYRVCKHTAHPGPRARDISPAPHGEFYSYVVEKYWTVEAVLGNELRLMTRRGKQRTVSANDPNLRSARWWERLFLRQRFPQLGAVSSHSVPSHKMDAAAPSA